MLILKINIKIDNKNFNIFQPLRNEKLFLAHGHLRTEDELDFARQLRFTNPSSKS